MGKKLILPILLLLIVTFWVTIECYSAGISEGLMFLYVLLACIPGIVWICVVVCVPLLRKDEWSWDIVGKQLYVYTRKRYIGDMLSIAPEIKPLLQYNPAQVTCTTVSVGAATVSNVDFKDEHTTMAGYKSGNYYLNFGSSRNYCPIERIVLSSSLAQLAKEHPVLSKYLQENTLVLKKIIQVPSNETSANAATLMNKGNLQDTTTAANALLFDMKTTALTKADCKEIKKWLSGQ